MSQHPYSVKFIVISLLLLIVIVVSSCNEAAIVEPINNPDQVRPEILLKRTMNNENGQTKSEIRVTLRNTKDQIVEIDSGSVWVNGQEMSPPNWSLFGHKRNYYYLIMPVEPDTEYEITVVSSYGDEASAWIRAPYNSLEQLMIPSEQNSKLDMKVKWLDADYQYPQYVMLEERMESGEFDEESGDLLYVRYPYKGEYTLKSKYLHSQDKSTSDYNEHRIYVISENEGALSEDFLEGGSIKCQIRIFQDFHVY